jgi:hypothetical protein
VSYAKKLSKHRHSLNVFLFVILSLQKNGDGQITRVCITFTCVLEKKPDDSENILKEEKFDKELCLEFDRTHFALADAFPV